ncbi:Uncharacterised protein [Mycobacterium tuberculosis]|nr:Uncharacterised protein [Mycobacterium tuberculosis]
MGNYDNLICIRINNRIEKRCYSIKYILIAFTFWCFLSKAMTEIFKIIIIKIFIIGFVL